MLDEVVVIAPLVPMSVGDEFGSGVGAVPLHMTVLPKICVPRDRQAAVAAAVREIAGAIEPISIMADGRAGFGHDGTVQVTTVEMSDALRRLHQRLLDAAHRVGAKSVQPAYNGDGYRPHISDTSDGQMIEPGERLIIRTLAILDCSSPSRRLTDKATLSGVA